MRGRLIVACIAAALMLSGCAGGPKVEKDAEYETAIALRDALVAAGYECPAWDDGDTSPDFDGGECLSDRRDQLRVYPSVEAREADLDGIVLGAQLRMVLAKIDMALLVGPNWSIVAPEEMIPGLREKLGGFEPNLGGPIKMPS